MLIKKSEMKKEYIRGIEGMGTGLVLLKVYSKEKRYGMNYHYFFEDNRKPPLDLAINPDDGMIEYISFFVQDELVEKREMKESFSIIDANVEFDISSFNDEINNKVLEEKFELFIDFNGNLWCLKNLGNNSINAYLIDYNNYILFDENNEFLGVLMKDLNHKELEQFVESDCIRVKS